jgi:hypothetical protein
MLYHMLWPHPSGKKVDKNQNRGKIPAQYCIAGVAELADALRSGRSENTLVRVQIPPSALKNVKKGDFSSPFQFNLREKAACGNMVVL